MSEQLYIRKDGVPVSSSTDAGISVTIAVDVDTVVCVNSNVVGEDGRHIVLAGNELTVTADSDSEKVTIVLHPGDLSAKCAKPRGEDTPKPKGP